jgi:hypothetical protein
MAGFWLVVAPRQQTSSPAAPKASSATIPAVLTGLKEGLHKFKNSVMPAKAGIQYQHVQRIIRDWIPAFAGMTTYAGFP